MARFSEALPEISFGRKRAGAIIFREGGRSPNSLAHICNAGFDYFKTGVRGKSSSPGTPMPGVTPPATPAPAPGGTRRRPSGKNHAGGGRQRRGSAATNPAARASRRPPAPRNICGRRRLKSESPHGDEIIARRWRSGGGRSGSRPAWRSARISARTAAGSAAGLAAIPANRRGRRPIRPAPPPAAGGPDSLSRACSKEAGAEADHRRRLQRGRQRLVQQPVAEAVLAAGEFANSPARGTTRRRWAGCGTPVAPAASAAENSRAWTSENADGGSRRPAGVSARPAREFRRGAVRPPPRRRVRPGRSPRTGAFAAAFSP